jgi:hypothetical protein
VLTMVGLTFQKSLFITYSEMEKYNSENNTHYKSLIIHGKAPGLTPFIGDLHPNIKLAFLLPHTTALIPPMY